MRESALEKADSALEQPQGHYRVPIVDPTYVFGRSEWDLNLWDVVCYCRHRARVAEFETEDLVAWLRGKHYTDERNAIRKAFQFALVRALERGLLIPVLRTGEPVDDLADPLAVLRFFTEEGIFTLDFPAWSSKVQTSAPSFSKPCGYLENGWVGATPAAAKAILNLLMYALKDGHTSLRIDKVYDFLGNYMMRKRIRTGIGQLIGLQLISIQRDRIVPRLNRLLEQAPTERTKSSLSDMLANILEVIGKKADPVGRGAPPSGPPALRVAQTTAPSRRLSGHEKIHRERSFQRARSGQPALGRLPSGRPSLGQGNRPCHRAIQTPEERDGRRGSHRTVPPFGQEPLRDNPVDSCRVAAHRFRPSRDPR